MLFDEIGGYAFVSMRGPFQPVMGEWTVTTRAGISGVSLHYQGKRGKPFTVRTIAFTANYETALQLYRDYCFLTNYSSVPLTKNGQLEPNLRALVQSVVPTGQGIRRILAGCVAGVPSVFYGHVEVEWTLLPLEEEVQFPS